MSSRIVLETLLQEDTTSEEKAQTLSSYESSEITLEVLKREGNMQVEISRSSASRILAKEAGKMIQETNTVIYLSILAAPDAQYLNRSFSGSSQLADIRIPCIRP